MVSQTTCCTTIHLDAYYMSPGGNWYRISPLILIKIEILSHYVNELAVFPLCRNIREYGNLSFIHLLPGQSLNRGTRKQHPELIKAVMSS